MRFEILYLKSYLIIIFIYINLITSKMSFFIIFRILIKLIKFEYSKKKKKKKKKKYKNFQKT